MEQSWQPPRQPATDGGEGPAGGEQGSIRVKGDLELPSNRAAQPLHTATPAAAATAAVAPHRRKRVRFSSAPEPPDRSEPPAGSAQRASVSGASGATLPNVKDDSRLREQLSAKPKARRKRTVLPDEGGAVDGRVWCRRPQHDQACAMRARHAPCAMRVRHADASCAIRARHAPCTMQTRHVPCVMRERHAPCGLVMWARHAPCRCRLATSARAPEINMLGACESQHACMQLLCL
eukprot:362948-Chlamydomonas_euryale.AAC.8